MDMNFSGPEKEMPELKIPGTPSVVMKGVTNQFMPVVMKCSLGGWIVIVPNRGISAWSSLEEAGEFLIDQAYVEMGEERPKKELPKFMQEMEKTEKTYPVRAAAKATLQVIAGILVVGLGVRIL